MQHGGGLANSKLVSMISTWEKAQTKRTTTTTATAMPTAMIATTTTTLTSTTTLNKQVAGKQANKQHFSCLAQKMAFLIAHYARLSSAHIAAKLHCKVDKKKGRGEELAVNKRSGVARKCRHYFWGKLLEIKRKVLYAS